MVSRRSVPETTIPCGQLLNQSPRQSGNIRANAPRPWPLTLVGFVVARAIVVMFVRPIYRLPFGEGTIAVDRVESPDVVSYSRTRTEFTLTEPGMVRWMFVPNARPKIKANNEYAIDLSGPDCSWIRTRGSSTSNE